MNTRVKIKICGLTRLCDVEAVNAAKPDYAGFVLAQSKRQVSPAQVQMLRARLSPGIVPVGVFVNAPAVDIAALLHAGLIEIAQLHGTETQQDIKQLRALAPHKTIIQAFAVRTQADILRAANSAADYVLLDSGPGGTGVSFAWEMALCLKRPFFLAGGLRPDNIAYAIRTVQPFCVDMSSGVETDGVKDAKKIKEAVRRIRNV